MSETERLQAQLELMIQLNQGVLEVERKNDELQKENMRYRYVLEQIHASTTRFCGSNERRLRRMIEKVLNNASD